MAMLPCTACTFRHPRRNAGVYCHLWNGGVQNDFRLRLCPPHLTALQHDLAECEIGIAEDATCIVNSPTNCLSCRQPTGQTDWHFSVTAYPAKDQRKDYWSRLHTDCRLPDWAQNGQPLL
jgi:hypothetical protein